MNGTTKSFATFSLAAAVGQKLIDSGLPSDVENGIKLYEAGFHASSVYPSHHLTNKAINRIGNAVNDLCPETTPVKAVLSMLIASLVDIRAHAQKNSRFYIDPLLKRVEQAMGYIDENDVIHQIAFNKYTKWAS